MKKMINKFLFEVMQEFPITDSSAAEEVINRFAKLIVEKLGDKEIDFEKAKYLLFTQYERRNYPSFPELLSYLKKAVIQKETPETESGSWYLLTLPNGKKYSFYPCSFSKTVEEYKEEWTKKFGEFTLQKCPPDSVLIGDKLFIPKEENIENTKRRFRDYSSNSFAKRIS